MRLLLLACLFCLLTPVRWVLAADPVSISVKEAPVKDVLQSLAQLANQNLVVDPDLSGTVSLELRDVPFRQALTVVTRSRGLECREEGNTFWVGTPEKLEARFGRLSLHPLEYISAKEAAETLKPLFNAPLTWDRESNALLFRATREK